MTIVKICGITELEQACWSLEAGADFLGFVLAPSRRQLPVETVAGILSQCHRRFPQRQRRWKSVGVFANQPLDLVKRAAFEAGLDCIQLSGQEPPEYCWQLALPLFKAVHLPAATSPQDETIDGGAGRPSPGELQPREVLAEARRRYGAVRMLLDSGGAGRWGGTGATFSWETIGDGARDCLVAGGLTPENVFIAIASMRPWGVDVSSGVERDGKKDRELIRQFVESAKGDKYHGHIG